MFKIAFLAIDEQFGSEEQFKYIAQIKSESKALCIYTLLLIIYKKYSKTKRTEDDRIKAFTEMRIYFDESDFKYDVVFMAANFFAKRITNHWLYFDIENGKEVMGKL
jgi:hypothetical protein